MSTSFDNQPGAISPGLEMQYRAVKDEILKRIELRHQIIVLCLRIAGIILGLGITNAAVALTYAPLATFLAAGWVHNNLRIRQLSRYVSSHIESALPGGGWDTYRIKIDAETHFFGWSLEILSASGLFVITEMITIVIGVVNFKYTPSEWFLLVVDIISFIWLVALIIDYRRQHRRYV